MSTYTDNKNGQKVTLEVGDLVQGWDYFCRPMKGIVTLIGDTTIGVHTGFGMIYVGKSNVTHIIRDARMAVTVCDELTIGDLIDGAKVDDPAVMHAFGYCDDVRATMAALEKEPGDPAKVNEAYAALDVALKALTVHLQGEIDRYNKAQ